jgi:hypothetical protein
MLASSTPLNGAALASSPSSLLDCTTLLATENIDAAIASGTYPLSDLRSWKGKIPATSAGIWRGRGCKDQSRDSRIPRSLPVHANTQNGSSRLSFQSAIQAGQYGFPGQGASR